jgi:alcohol dehydrogenase (cytochrome c)
VVERLATFFPPTFDAKRQIAYAVGGEGCTTGYVIRTPMDETKDWVGLRMCCQETGRATAHGALWALDVRTGKIVAKAEFPLPNESGLLSTDGGLLFAGQPNGRFAAYDADTLAEVWNFSLGTPITAPPMSYSVGRQAICRRGGWRHRAGARGGTLSTIGVRRGIRAVRPLRRIEASGRKRHGQEAHDPTPAGQA